MSLKLVSCKLSSPIDRVRASETVVVSVECEYSDGKNSIKVAGIATTAEDTAGALRAAFLEAQENAKQNAETLYNAKFAATTNNKLVKTLLEPKLEPAKEKYFSAVDEANKKEVPREPLISKLEGPVNEKMTAEINGLCEALGIDLIDLADWNMLEALALIEELRQKAKRLEAS